MTKTRPSLIGVTGTIGSGKSTACGIIAERYPVLSSDEIARGIVAEDESVRASILAAFGDGVFGENGALRREALADIVFRDARKLAVLNAIIHPVTIERIGVESRRLFAEGHTIIFVESALIYEAGIEDTFDAVIVIAAREETVKARLRSSAQFSEEDWTRRNLHQMPAADKIAQADFTIHNDGTEAELRGRIAFILTILATLHG